MTHIRPCKPRPFTHRSFTPHPFPSRRSHPVVFTSSVHRYAKAASSGSAHGEFWLAHSLAQICSAATLLLCLALGTWLWFGRALFPTSIAAPQRLIWSLMLLVMLGCEGVSASAWELLLVSRQTAFLALRQGLFFPLRLLMAAVGSLVLGVSGALG